MWLEHPAPVVISEGIGEAISDSKDSASPLGSKRGHNRLGRRGIDDFIIGRDPASTVYQAIVPRITAKKVVIREKTVLVWVARNLATALVRSHDSAGLVGSVRDQLPD